MANVKGKWNMSGRGRDLFPGHQNGKGDKSRITNDAAYKANYDLIDFGHGLERACPGCGVVIHYSRRGAFNRAVEEQRQCDACKARGRVHSEETKQKMADAHTKHGFASADRHPLYAVWSNMIQRCTNPEHPSFLRYGGRGICVCAEWQTADNFLVWASQNGWLPGLQLDRINNDGNYEPNNCRFVTQQENLANRGGQCASQPAANSVPTVPPDSNSGAGGDCCCQRSRKSSV